MPPSGRAMPSLDVGRMLNLQSGPLFAFFSFRNDRDFIVVVVMLLCVRVGLGNAASAAHVFKSDSDASGSSRLAGKGASLPSTVGWEGRAEGRVTVCSKAAHVFHALVGATFVYSSSSQSMRAD